MTKNIVRVGLIGGGMMGGLHLMAYPWVKNAILVGIYDISEHHAKNSLLKTKTFYTEYMDAAEKSNDMEECEKSKTALEEIKIYREPEALFEAVDCVDICTPPRFHIRYALIGAETNTHVMCEKPVTRTVLEAEMIERAFSESSALFQLNENYLFDERVLLIRKLVSEGKVGDVDLIICGMGNSGPYSKWYCTPEIAGGGCLIDLGPHTLGSAWYLAGLDAEPRWIKSEFIGIKQKQRTLNNWFERMIDPNAQYKEEKATMQVDDEAHLKILFEHPEGNITLARIINSYNYALKPGFWVKVLGSKGFLSLPLIEQRIYIGEFTNDGREEITQIVELSRSRSDARAATIVNEIQYFVECIRSRSPSMMNEKWATKMMKVFTAGYLSESRSRATIALDEVDNFNSKFTNSACVQQTADEILSRLLTPIIGKRS